MKTRRKVILSTILLLIVLVIFFFFFEIKDKKLIRTDLNDIISVCVTEYEADTIIIEDKDAIAKIINYLESLEKHLTLNPLSKHENWNLRIGISGPFEGNLSIMKESFYITHDGKVYKRFFTYNLVNFNYDYFLSLVK